MAEAAESTALAMLEQYIDPGKTWSAAEENQLSMLLSFSASKILARKYPFRSTYPEFPETLLPLQIQIAVELYNKMGAEGQTVHNENGINRTWASSDVAQVLLREVVPEVGVVGYDAATESE